MKNYFNPKSKGNTVQEGFDDTAKRQADFSAIMRTQVCERSSGSYKIDPRSTIWEFPTDVFIMVNETLTTDKNTSSKYLQVIPLRYDEYTRLMSKPFKRPLKNQAWRLLNSSETDTDNGAFNHNTKKVEIVTNAGVNIKQYQVRYIRRPDPIILVALDDDSLSINGYTGAYGGKLVNSGATDGYPCQLDESLHEDILQRAVELAKTAWVTTNSGENLQAVVTAGQRSE